MRFACLINRSINPRRPYRLEDTSYINELPYVRSLEEKKQARARIRDIKKRTYANAQATFQREFGDDPLGKSHITQGSRKNQKRWKIQKKNMEKLGRKFHRVEDQF